MKKGDAPTNDGVHVDHLKFNNSLNLVDSDTNANSDTRLDHDMPGWNNIGCNGNVIL